MAQASFYPLFAFLFGFGAIILAIRSEEKGIAFPVLFTKRLSFLLVLGCIHAFFIWHGDILINYAVFGFALLFFYQMKGKTLILVGTVCYVLPFAILGALLLVMGSIDSEGLAIQTDSTMMKRSLEIYQSSTFLQIVNQRALDWYKVNNLANSGILFYRFFRFS